LVFKNGIGVSANLRNGNGKYKSLLFLNLEGTPNTRHFLHVLLN
jgi:hypothetical protein